ncbi:post-segregation killing protein PndC [Salmonella enterica]|nr:post-segregation killing protein PndC [Salmonella enterica]EEH2567240.1 post-segregation killing protein PndC [Salmonella enterica]EHM3440598.1 post-segregation killing protein PndC [Salmonella enterica subsp. enterica]EHW9181147.1 post-segregation killing protein PndC [Salmonella enterica subsp. enterica]EIX6431230.1 post-segregation killing protein PndC [Salmonella enterica]
MTKDQEKSIMSTRSSITVKTTDGKFRTIYCHFDGYPSGVGKTLAQYYDTQEKAETLLAGGDISFLEASCDKPEGHSFENPVEGYTVYYGRDRGETGTEPRTYYSFYEVIKKESQDFNYFLDGRQWVYFTRNNSHFHPVEK